MDSIDPRISNRLSISRNFAFPGRWPVAPEMETIPKLADSVWLTPPPAAVMSDADLALFMQKMMRMKQEALRQRGLNGMSGSGATRPDKVKEQTGDLNVRAHGYYEGNKLVAVREIRIFEIDNYRKRTYDYFPGGWPDNSLRMNNARVGKYYRVKVTWENGATQEKDVRMDSPGMSVDVWKY